MMQSKLGEQLQFMSDYVNATNREVEAHMDGDTCSWRLPMAKFGKYRWRSLREADL